MELWCKFTILTINKMPKYLVLFLMFLSSLAYAQTEINFSDFKQSKDVKAKIQQELLSVSWTTLA